VFIKALGYGEDALSRPIIGIINTYSGFNPCHTNVPQFIDAVKRGVQLHGGLPIDFPTISLHELFSSPTSMFLRNLMSMDTEEMIRAQPVDACIMIGGQLVLGQFEYKYHTRFEKQRAPAEEW
jgi:dihydroxy-acid dehydratase